MIGNILRPLFACGVCGASHDALDAAATDARDTIYGVSNCENELSRRVDPHIDSPLAIDYTFYFVARPPVYNTEQTP